MVLDWAFGYLLIGLVFAVVGPVAKLIRTETRKVSWADEVPFWKVICFGLILGGAVAAFWPLLVPAALLHLRKEKKQRENSFFGLLNGLTEDGTDQDEFPGGLGEFGLAITNPVPTNTIIGSASYLGKLRTEDGSKITYERVGSFTSEVSPMPIDMYQVFSVSGCPLAKIYVSPYQKQNSRKTPRGFRFEHTSWR